MILTLENFRCYRGIHKFEFLSTGITLISGISGSGKTTIVMAIYFAITGISPPKVITDGCDSCSVVFEDKNFKVKRTKRPNRVVVETDGIFLEDEIAQEYIYRKFGKYYEFTSFIQQQYQKTFLYLSASEKLEILEKLCFNDTDQQPEILKKECSNVIKNHQEQLIRVKSKIDTLEQLISGLESSSPEKPKETIERSLILKELNTIEKQEEINKLIKNLQQMYDDTQQTLQKLESVIYNEQELNQQLFLQTELKKLKEKELFTPWEKYTKDEALELVNTYENDIRLHREYKQIHSKTKELEPLNDRLNDYKHQLLTINESIEGIYQCPSCHTNVCLQNNKLCILTTENSKIIQLEKKTVIIRQLEQKINELEYSLKHYEHYKERIGELSEEINPEEDINDLETDLLWIKNYIKTHSQMENEKGFYENRIQEIEKQIYPEIPIEKISSYLDILKQKNMYTQTLENIKIELQTKQPLLNNRIDNLQNRKEFLLEELERQREIEIYEFKLSNYQKFLDHSQQIQELRQQQTEIERQLNAMVEFKQIILKTESDIIQQNTICISELVNQFIAEMFIEPITIELKTVKKTATNNEKVQIQLEVYYKNMKCDVGLLSGGEQARLNLAFTLAFASVFESPLILLDECTSNLDSSMTEIVLEQIQNAQTDGMPKIIIIAHQVVEGSFEQIIRL